jgi:uncharacterized Ntn-hydrolase superfamily protein
MVLSQNVTNPRLGVLGTRLLAQGFGAASVLEQLVKAGAYPEYRQVLVLDLDGGLAHHSGSQALGTVGLSVGRDCIAAGNMLASDQVPAIMTEVFDDMAAAPLPERLMAAIEAGLEAGGEAGPVHSAGMCVYGREVWPLAELRVDWSDTPIEDLRLLWELYKPQMQDYYTRAKNPKAAPSYGVPGDP